MPTLFDQPTVKYITQCSEIASPQAKMHKGHKLITGQLLNLKSFRAVISLRVFCVKRRQQVWEVKVQAQTSENIAPAIRQTI
jgi:hypothetical protein